MKSQRDQRESIQELLKMEEFVLIVLDSCRYDYLKKIHEDTQRRVSPVYHTSAWFKRVFPDKYDITYISPIHFPESPAAYRPTDHFKEVIDAWKLGGGSRRITESALRHTDRRMLIHYMSPHLHIRDASESFKKGKRTLESIQAEYFENLKSVWAEVEKVISNVTQKVVVTADHAELLGENGEIGHGPTVSSPAHPKLFEVPWLEIPREEKLIKRRLEELGYR